jgi:hypothetical protein
LKKLVALLVGITAVAVAVATVSAANSFRAQPWEFVGAAGDCGPTAGTDTVDARWVAKEGLPDAGKSDHALLLQKLGDTSNCAGAGATIDGVSGITLTEIGFDYQLDGHCGAGAPRFNVLASDGFHFVGGCAHGTPVGAPIVDAQGDSWQRVRIDPTTQAFPPITPGATIISIDIIFDEGTDTGPDNTGTVLLDNIDINGTLIGKPGSAK